MWGGREKWRDMAEEKEKVDEPEGIESKCATGWARWERSNMVIVFGACFFLLYIVPFEFPMFSLGREV